MAARSLRKSKLPIKTHRVHLEAVGRIAANWSELEMSMITVLATISKGDLVHTLILAGPSTFEAWTDMAILLVRRNPELAEREAVLSKLLDLMLKLRRLRNFAVHAAWEENSSGGKGIIGSVMEPPEPKRARDPVMGWGIPKRGRDVIKRVVWTAPQLRHVAHLIEEADVMLAKIVHRPQPTSPRERIAHALLDRSILQRIRAMLDSLPDPFPRLQAKKSGPQTKG